jgi:hypothetical protein
LRLASRRVSDYIGGRRPFMRAEMTAIVEGIKQSVGLLRRHL